MARLRLFVVVVFLSSLVWAQGRDREVPAGTVLKLSMDNMITSSDSRVGDPFTATVFEDVVINREVVIPQGARVQGRVTSVTPAQRPNKSGMIAVDFEKITFPSGGSLLVEGQLTSLDPAERRQIDEEGRVGGDSTARRNVIFIGGGAAGGAAIGAIAGGGKGAGIGAVIGAGAGILGALLQKGEEAQVFKGQKFGMELLRSVRVPASYLVSGRGGYEGVAGGGSRGDSFEQERPVIGTGSGGRDVGARPPAANLNSADMIRRAQTELARLGYYRGPANGTLTLTTKNALRAYQRERQLEETGELDLDTAHSLGLVDDYGREIVPMRVLSAEATKQRDGSILVKATAQARTGGWQVYADSRPDGDLLRVYVRGIPPAGVATQALTSYPVEAVVREGRGINKVEVIGDGQPVVIELSAAGIARQNLLRLQQQAAQLLTDYREMLGVVRRGSSQLTDASRLTEQQARLLMSLDSLYGASYFAQQLFTARATEEAMRGAVASLVRMERQIGRLIRASADASRYLRQWEDISVLIRSLGDAYQVDLVERE
ncbi:MAG: peptidoglycan-binding protein [Acidobacteriota bacterium]|nr:peptidoglycan-binding protein [Blastocatellia bacterium]MDW8412139.1 peptidoglycan-binding protein [Acidobacteriota bacterium]